MMVSIFRQSEGLKAQIVDTQKLLEMVLDHPLMSQSLIERLKWLNEQLEKLPKESFEPTVQLLFSGGAVLGSQGIKSSFVSKTIAPFQEMVKAQVALIRFGKVGKRGQPKKSSNTELYLTALPVGSFGIELSQLQATDLFESMEVSKAIKDVMKLVEVSASDDPSFEAAIEETPKRNLSNLRKFLEEISSQGSVLKMESGELGIELPQSEVLEAYARVSAMVAEEDDVLISGVLRGILLDSGRFEIQDEEGKKLSGFISEDLAEEQLIEYDRLYLNKTAKVHLTLHKTTFKTGNIKTEYELQEITSL